MKKKNIWIMVNWVLVWAYCSAVFILSSSPSVKIMPRIAHADKLAHFAAFLILGILFFRAYHPLGLKIYRLVLLTLISSTLFGILIEIHQHYLPYRSAEAMDVAADVAGCLAGIGAVAIFSRIGGHRAGAILFRAASAKKHDN